MIKKTINLTALIIELRDTKQYAEHLQEQLKELDEAPAQIHSLFACAVSDALIESMRAKKYVYINR